MSTLDAGGYRIKYNYGGLFVYDSTGEPVDKQALAQIIRGLCTTFEEMEECDQEEARYQRFIAEGQRVVSEATIHYPVTHPHACYTEHHYRPTSEKRFAGVYVLSAPANPGMVKIGLSKDVFLRTKAFFHQLGKEPITLHVILEHSEYRLLEEYLHYELNDYRGEGEWFEDKPVLDYMKGLVQS